MFPVSYLSRTDLEAAGRRLGVSGDVIRAVAAVEARGSGFIAGTDLPAILFEGHIFHRETGGRFGESDISYPSWTKKHYRGGRGEYDRLARAVKLDLPAALKSASWGLFQIMGFNHEAAGYPDVRAYVNAISVGEGPQLMAFARFVEANPAMHKAIRSRAWAYFARRYNGPGYRKNEYDTRLAAAFARAADDDHDLERADWRALQAALNVAIDAGLVVDGWDGPKTQAALRTYQPREGLPATGEPDEATIEALGLGIYEEAA